MIRKSPRLIYRAFAILMCIAGITVCACDPSTFTAPVPTDIPNDTGPPSVTASRRAITADWMNRTLSIIDLDALKKGATYEDVLIDKITIDGRRLGPLDVAVTKDGKLALVSISGGFFSVPGAGALVDATIPSGSGALLFVDLDTLQVVDTLNTGNSPMSIVLNEDDSRAIVAHFGSNFLTVVDVPNRSIVERVNVGIYSEEIAFDDTYSVGIVSYSARGNTRTFSVADPSRTLSRGLSRSGDAAGVAFFPGTKIAFVVQAINPLTSPQGGYDLIDVSNPSSPRLLDSARSSEVASAYAIVSASNRGTVLTPINQNDQLSLREYSLNGSSVSLEQTIPVCPSEVLGALGMMYDAATERAIMTVPRHRIVAVTDLNTKESFTVTWPGSDVGPADITLIP